MLTGFTLYFNLLNSILFQFCINFEITTYILNLNSNFENGVYTALILIKFKLIRLIYFCMLWHNIYKYLTGSPDLLEIPNQRPNEV